MRACRTWRGSTVPTSTTKFGGRFFYYILLVSLVHDPHNREQSLYIHVYMYICGTPDVLEESCTPAGPNPTQGVHVMVLGPAADVPSRRWSPISLTGRRQDRCSSARERARAHTHARLEIQLFRPCDCAEILRSSGCRRRGGTTTGRGGGRKERKKKKKKKEVEARGG